MIPLRKAGRGPGGPFEEGVEEGEGDDESSSEEGFRFEMAERKARFGRAGGSEEEDSEDPFVVGGVGFRRAAMRARRGSTSVGVEGLDSSPAVACVELGFRRAAMRARRGSTSVEEGASDAGASS